VGVELRLLPISYQLIKIIFLIIIFAGFFLFTSDSPLFALEEGGGKIETEYRSHSNETPINDTNQYEMNTHLDVWQNLPNAGTLQLWLDRINGRGDNKISKLGKGYIALTDLRYNGFIIDGLVGDSTLNFINPSQKFSNAMYADLNFSGFQTDLRSQWGRIEAFMGKPAQLNGLLGKTYDTTGEVLYGFNGSFSPIQKLLLGTGFIRTQNEADNLGRPLTKNNNILMFNFDLEIFNWMKWLTEFRLSNYQGEPGIESKQDYLLRLGPIINNETFRFEASLRRIGTDYHFVNLATQGDSDQEGLFFLTEYRPLKGLALFGNADHFHDNVSNMPGRNTIDNTRGLIGISVFKPGYSSFFVTFNKTDRKNKFNLPLPVNNICTSLFSEVRYEYWDVKPYLRYNPTIYRDEIHPEDSYNQKDITLGMHRNFKQDSIVYIEGELNHKSYQDRANEADLSGKIGFSYHLTSNLLCWGEVNFVKMRDSKNDSRIHGTERALGLNAKLPWDIQAYSDIRYAKNISSDNDKLKAQGINISFKVVKKFNWGKSEKIAGLKQGVDTEGNGAIEGFVFNDINRNGIQDNGEVCIKGITIALEDGSIVKTDESGYYKFSKVEIGRHLVNLDVKRIPAKYNIISSEKMYVDVKLRKTIQTNFQLIAAGKIQGSVINDGNGNGKIDPGETGVSDVLVYLEPGKKNIYTGEDGKFKLQNILPGVYTLKVDSASLPEDAIVTSSEERKFEVTVGGELKDMNFLIYVKPRTIIMGPPKEK
jgi:hypothetical protein